jgi:hypothetical protein
MMTFMLANVGLWQITTLRLTSKAGMAAGCKGRCPSAGDSGTTIIKWKMRSRPREVVDYLNLHDPARSG